MIAVINVTQFSIRHNVVRPKWNECLLFYCPHSWSYELKNRKKLFPRCIIESISVSHVSNALSYQCRWNQYLTLLPIESDCQNWNWKVGLRSFRIVFTAFKMCGFQYFVSPMTLIVNENERFFNSLSASKTSFSI